MAVGERQRRKMPSFSSSLLDAIYHSIDEQPNLNLPLPQRRNVDDEIESLRRAIMVEKWMENYTATATARARHHLPSNSSSSTDSIFTSSETDSSSTPKADRFSRTKSKKAKEPVSPAARIASFLNSIFSPRNNNLKKDHPAVRKSRSMKDTAAAAAATSRSCLTSSSKNLNINNKSKRCVRFCPPVHQDSLVYNYKKKMHMERDFDDNKSCASSDLFELENIGPYDQELPVYGTTHLKINRAIATAFNMY